MKDLLTIPELAEATGKKKQGLYEQTKNKASKLYPYLVFQGSKAYVRSEALTELYGIDQDETTKSQGSQVRSQESQGKSQDSQPESQVSQDNSQGASQESQDGDPVKSQESQAEDQPKSQGEPKQGQDMIAFLQEMLREKDKQIAQLTQLLDQEQQLHARTNLLLAEYQKKEAEADQEEQPEEPDTAGEEVGPEQDQNLEPKKHGWLYRFFFGED